MDWAARVRSAFEDENQPVPDDDVVEELAQHAAALYQASRASGCTAADADRSVRTQITAWTSEAAVLRRPVRRPVAPTPPPSHVEPELMAAETGPPPLVTVEARSTATGPAPGTRTPAGWWNDVRYAARLLAREPAHSSLVIATMALGIAAATTLFSVTYGVLLKPLPWLDPDRLVRVIETRAGGAPRVAGTLSNGTYLAWRDRRTTIEDVGGWMGGTMTLTGAGDPVRLPVAPTTPSLFRVLRARPSIGRLFVPEDDESGSAVILSNHLWHERFGGREDIIGRAIQLDGKAHTVVGVMAADFEFPDRDARAWIPFSVPPVVGDGGMRRMSIFRALARLRPGTSPAQAASEATAAGRGAPDPGLAAMALFGSRGPVEVSIVPALDALTADVRPAITLLFAAVVLLLATATANVASLQLARAATRRRELAIRAALGAGAGRLARQVLVESTLVGLVGGLVGLALAHAMTRALPWILPPDFPRLETITIDVPAALFAVAVSLAAGLACSVLPALHVRRANLVEALTEDSLAPVGARLRSRTARIRGAIIVGQVAAACVLLVGASLVTRSFVAQQRADRGYDPAQVVTARVPMSRDYPDQRRKQVLDGTILRLTGLPGVTAAAYANSAPLISMGGFSAFTMRLPGQPDKEVAVEAQQRVVTPGYFAALGLRMLQGRPLADSDNATSPPVVVVNHTFAGRYLGGRAVVGSRIPRQGTRAGLRLKNDDDGWEVVGVVRDVRQQALDAPPQPEIFVAYSQVEPETIRAFDPVLVVRTTGDPASVVAPLRALLREQDAALALDSIMTMEERIATSLAKPRTYAALFGGFALLALVISSVGLFGVLAYTVTQRSREIGVRAALGASPRAIVMLVGRQAGGLVAWGLGIGLATAFLAARALSSLLYAVPPRDAASFAGVAALLAVVAGVAAVVPARRAARVDPLTVLK